MDIFLSVIAFIVIFSVLILIHEWGHFISARRSGITVTEFGIGLPPRIWGKQFGETLYSVNAIPFGGFVRLLGEDTSDPEQLKNKKAFIAKPIRVRAKVVVAGVAMNFLLALLLLAIGFTFGIRPLIVNSDDLLAGIASGHLVIEPGIVVKDVLPGSAAARAGIKAGDRIISLNGKKITEPSVLETALKGEKDFSLGTPSLVTLERTETETTFGLKLHELVLLPRVRLHTIPNASPLFQSGLRPGDILLTLDNRQVYDPDVFRNTLQEHPSLAYTAYRNDTVVRGEIRRENPPTIIVSNVLPESPAGKAGLLPGDLILRVNETPIYHPKDLQAFAQTKDVRPRTYRIARDGSEMTLTITPNAQGFIGVVIAQLFETSLLSDLAFYPTTLTTSVTEIRPVQLPVWRAPFAALAESVRLTKFTVQMFGNILRTLVSRLEVPEGIAGPIGIAQLTHSFVQEGFLSLLRFTALLSLSLAVINILPIPALDGGRLLFIIVELVRGRRGNLKVERFAHSLGFALLIALLIAVTYKDLLRIFAS